MSLELRGETKTNLVHLKNLEGSSVCVREEYQNEWLRKARLWAVSRKTPGKVKPWGLQELLPQCHKVMLSHHIFTRLCSLIYLQKVLHGVFLCLYQVVFSYYSFPGCVPLPYLHNVIFSPTSYKDILGDYTFTSSYSHTSLRDSYEHSLFFLSCDPYKYSHGRECSTWYGCRLWGHVSLCLKRSWLDNFRPDKIVYLINSIHPLLYMSSVCFHVNKDI